MDFHSENEFEKLVHLDGFIKRILKNSDMRVWTDFAWFRVGQGSSSTAVNFLSA